MKLLSTSSTPSDSELVALSARGERDAFGQLVNRYATLACSVAYSACGNFDYSRDLAQESFVAAWRQLPQLREPSKFRVWLCGIVRNVAANRRRRQRTEPAAGAGSLDEIREPASDLPSPDAEAISREQSALVWSALEKLPEQFREPLVLFYREGHSVERVAESLDLSVDTAKQRLSRGRVALREELAAVIGEVLDRSRPGAAFSVAVLAALPALVIVPKASAAVAMTSAGGAAAKAGLFSGPFLALVAGPAFGILGGFFGYKISLLGARSDRERELQKKYAVHQTLSMVLFSVAIWAMTLPLWSSENRGAVLAWFLQIWCVAFFADALLRALKLSRALRRFQEDKQGLDPKTPSAGGIHWKSSTVLLGLPLWEIAFDAPGAPRGPAARAWFAFGSVAQGVVFAVGGVAVGGIAVGGVSVGLVSIGGVALGGIAAGGSTIGAIAVGGAALGWVALGGVACAWHLALGGMALARNFAVGGSATALHANDELARALVANWDGPGKILLGVAVGAPLLGLTVVACFWKPICECLMARRAPSDT